MTESRIEIFFSLAELEAIATVLALSCTCGVITNEDHARWNAAMKVSEELQDVVDKAIERLKTGRIVQ